MRDWFIWNGVRCTEYGITVLEQPVFTIPAERATFTDVPGRSGSLTATEGDFIYDDIILAATCIVQDSTRLSEIAGWLRGSGKVTFADRDGGFYYARIVDQIPFEKILRGNQHRTFIVHFRCKPFWYVDPTDPITITTSGTFVQNPGNVPSEPVITLTGSGNITLMVGKSIVEIFDLNGSITIDSQLRETYNAATSLNEYMSGDFPILLPGANPISWNGDVSSILLQPNWRYL